MTRKAFLAGIGAMIAAPFVLKRKKEITISDKDRQWLNANPVLLERATFTNCKEQQEKFLREEIEPRIRLSNTITIKGDDLIAAINRRG